jgi:hypothetical protein
MASMKVNISMSGGFAGNERLNLEPIDTQWLEELEIEQIRMSIKSLKRITASRKKNPVDADMFHYDIKVEYDDGRKDHLIVTDEDDLNTPVLVQLLNFTKLSA